MNENENINNIETLDSAEKLSGGITHQKRPKGNMWARILSILAAVIIWFYAVSVDTTISHKNYNELMVVNENAEQLIENYNISVISGSDASVDVTVEGKKNVINKLKKSDINVSVDLSGITEAGEYDLPVKTKVPNGLTVTTCYPSTITVFVDEEISETKTIKTSAQYVKANSDFIVTETLSNSTVIVTGPKSVVGQIEWAVANIDLGTLTNSVDAQSRITLVDKYGNLVENTYLRTSLSEITAHYDVSTYKTIQLKTDLKNKFLTDNQLTVSLSQDTLKVKGEVTKIKDFNEFVFYTLDEQLLTGDTFSSNVRITLPEGFENVDENSEVTVTAQLNKVATKKIIVYLDSPDITIKPPTNSTNYTFQPNYISVILRGSEEALAAATVADLHLVIDLSTITKEGKSIVPVQIKIDDSKKFFEVYQSDKKDDYQVEVNIQ